MPYIVCKTIEYLGQILRPGQPLGDDHPKRSLVQTGKVKWVAADGDSKLDPLARLGDRSIPDVIPIQRESRPAAPVNANPRTESYRIDVPELAEVVAAGYAPSEAQVIVARCRVGRRLMDEGASVEEAGGAAYRMSDAELLEAVGETPIVVPAPEPKSAVMAGDLSALEQQPANEAATELEPDGTAPEDSQSDGDHPPRELSDDATTPPAPPSEVPEIEAPGAPTIDAEGAPLADIPAEDGAASAPDSERTGLLSDEGVDLRGEDTTEEIEAAVASIGPKQKPARKPQSKPSKRGSRSKRGKG